jgi:hypothetical protein
MSKTVIYYFSATGNSLAVARSIANRLGDTQLVHMTKQADTVLPKDLQRVGLVFPAYIFGLPLIVTRCIERLKIPGNIYVFAAATHGGIPCATLTQAEEVFSKSGMHLSSGFAVLMVDNATMNADTIPIEKQKKRIAKAEKGIDDICAQINKEETVIYRGWPLVNWLFSSLYRKAIPNLPTLDKNFSVDEKCNGCGI